MTDEKDGVAGGSDEAEAPRGPEARGGVPDPAGDATRKLEREPVDPPKRRRVRGGVLRADPIGNYGRVPEAVRPGMSDAANVVKWRGKPIGSVYAYSVGKSPSYVRLRRFEAPRKGLKEGKLPHYCLERVFRPADWEPRPEPLAAWFAVPLQAMILPTNVAQGLVEMIVKDLVNNPHLGYDRGRLWNLFGWVRAKETHQLRRLDGLYEAAEELRQMEGPAGDPRPGASEDKFDPGPDSPGTLPNDPSTMRTT